MYSSEFFVVVIVLMMILAGGGRTTKLERQIDRRSFAAFLPAYFPPRGPLANIDLSNRANSE